MIKQTTPVYVSEHKDHHHCEPCITNGYLQTDNFLAEYSGNPAPVLNNLGVYSKEDIDRVLKEMDRLVSIVKDDNIVTITDNNGKQVSFKILGGSYEYILDHFGEEVHKIARVVSEDTIAELTPDIADDRIEKSGIVEKKINNLVPDLAKKEIEESGIVERKINEIAPGLADDEINKLVPDIAYEQAQKAIKDESTGIIKEVAETTVKELAGDIAREAATEEINKQVPGIAKEQAIEQINTLVPDIAKTEAEKVADKYFEEYLSWNFIEDETTPTNPFGELPDDTESES